MFSTLSTVSSAAPSAPRARNRPGEGERLRTEIVDAADALLADAGTVERLSLRGIARAAGITAPAIYAHFATKEALVAAVIERRFAGLADALEAVAPTGGDESGVPSSAPADPADLVRARARAYVRFGLEHPGVYAAIFGPGADHLGLAFEGSPGQRVFALLLDPVAAAVSPHGAEPFARAADLWAALHGVVTLRSTLTGFPWSDLGAQVDRLVDGLLAS